MNNNYVFLREIGFMKCASEHCVCVRRSSNNELIVICLCVDDFLIIESCEKEIEDFKPNIMKEFEMT